MAGPQRIICLTEETAEFLSLLGMEDRIVGVSAYAVRPAGIRDRKPTVCAFVGGSVAKIVDLKPDLVIGFSDVQAKLAAELIAAQQNVWVTNQRSVDEILRTLLDIGRMVDAGPAAQALVDGFRARLDAIAARSGARPRVCFEEWMDPPSAGIRWVSELMEIAGGTDVFSDLSHGRAFRERHIPEGAYQALDPEIFFASWCGKPFEPEQVKARPGMSGVTAIREDRMVEVPSELILQPGPAALTDGLDALVRAVDAWRAL